MTVSLSAMDVLCEGDGDFDFCSKTTCFVVLTLSLSTSSVFHFILGGPVLNSDNEGKGYYSLVIGFVD